MRAATRERMISIMAEAGLGGSIVGDAELVGSPSGLRRTGHRTKAGRIGKSKYVEAWN